MQSLTQYGDQTFIRERAIDGIPQWRWIRGDNGAWDGPVDDWITSHKAAYQAHVKDWSVVVQAGGNLGLYPRLLSQMFGIVYTFEPDPLNFYHLVQNCQVDNIIKIQAAVGFHREPVMVNRLTMDNVGMHQVTQVDRAAIPQLRIDDLNLKTCGLIALDVEGYEINALNGAIETIRRCKPVIACERPTHLVLAFMEVEGYVKAQESKMDTIFVPR
jgi:FkbM family methyltransferase